MWPFTHRRTNQPDNREQPNSWEVRRSELLLRHSRTLPFQAQPSQLSSAASRENVQHPRQWATSSVWYSDLKKVPPRSILRAQRAGKSRSLPWAGSDLLQWLNPESPARQPRARHPRSAQGLGPSDNQREGQSDTWQHSRSKTGILWSSVICHRQ